MVSEVTQPIQGWCKPFWRPRQVVSGAPLDLPPSILENGSWQWVPHTDSLPHEGGCLVQGKASHLAVSLTRELLMQGTRCQLGHAAVGGEGHFLAALCGQFPRQPHSSSLWTHQP